MVQNSVNKFKRKELLDSHFGWVAGDDVGKVVTLSTIRGRPTQAAGIVCFRVHGLV